MSDRSVFFSCLSCLLGLLAFPVLVVAQPANDDCADAIPITDGDTGYSTVNSTTDVRRVWLQRLSRPTRWTGHLRQNPRAHSSLPRLCLTIVIRLGHNENC